MARKERKRKEAGAGGKRRLVYHVFHWDQRYAVNSRDWPTERGLLFVRQFVSPADTESTSYFGQLQDLRTLAGDDPTYHHFKSLWEDLRAICATQGRIHQGYLIDEQQQPLSEVQIAVRLHVGEELARRVLKALCAVNLMERIALPSFADIKRQQAEVERTSGEQNDSCGAQNRGKRRSCAQNSAEPANCSTGDAGDNGPGGGKNADSGPPGGAGGLVSTPPGATSPLKGNGLNGNGNPNQKEETANGCAKGQDQAAVTPRQGERQGTAEPCPPTTQPQEPIKPKGAEREREVEPVRHTGLKPSPDSLSAQRGTLGACTTQVIRRLSGTAQPFAEWVYTKLGLLHAHPVNTEPWRREVAAIGGVWAYAETQLSGDWLEGFKQWAYARAEYCRDNRSQWGSHVRKWMSDAKYEIRNRKKKANRAT